ncbi:MAG: LON peptidase substrate-binding domain-containing protein [Candidatus Hydrogenedentes bacterium]|nr:LON peptidase substrate-binding domain-containing protein [Candidatus Hydrogenedentota bacterium]
MSKFLPLFPLKLVVFPREKLKLHIFEPRYKQLINECRENAAMTFGIPPYIDDRVADFGVEVRLQNVFQVDDSGEMDILVEGIQAFQLDSFVREAPDKLYPVGDVVPIENDPTTDPVTTRRLADAFARFHALLNTGYERDNFDVPSLSFQVAQEVGMTLEQKVQLLATPKEADRQLLLVEHLDKAIPLLTAAEDTRRRVRGNGHFARLPAIDL